MLNQDQEFSSDLQANKRVQAIYRILSDGEPHQAGRIAYQLGVSARTIRRTLHHMRDELKMPIQVGRKGFFVEGAVSTNENREEKLTNA